MGLKEGSRPSIVRTAWVGMALSADWMRPCALTDSYHNGRAHDHRIESIARDIARVDLCTRDVVRCILRYFDTSSVLLFIRL